MLTIPPDIINWKLILHKQAKDYFNMNRNCIWSWSGTKYSFAISDFKVQKSRNVSNIDSVYPNIHVAWGQGIEDV